MKKVWSSLKPYLRWVVLGGTLFFLAQAFNKHAAEVVAIRITSSGWTNLAIALLLTLLAHTWAGWVWSYILLSFKQPVRYRWTLQVYLKTNLAKYIPGNIWHYYGRIWAVKDAGGSLSAAAVSVVLEPILMATAALAIAVVGSQYKHWILQVLILACACLAVHPRILNPVIRQASRLKGKAKSAVNNSLPEHPIEAETSQSASFQVERYPLLPLLGEFGFLGLRGGAFLFTLLAVTPVNPSQLPQIFSAFSFAWLLGLVVPGAPGGMGIFEATAITLLDRQFSGGIILSAVALFRLVSILAEVIAAGLAWLSEWKK